MGSPQPQIYQPGAAALLGAFSLGAVPAATIGAPVLFEVWNSHGDASADPATDLRLEIYERAPGETFYHQNGSATIQGWVEFQVTGTVAGSGVPIGQVIGWTPAGRNRPFRIADIPADSGRACQVRLNVPAGAATAAWEFLIEVRYAEPSIPLDAGVFESGKRGVVSGVGDGNASFLISGGVGTASGSPDQNVNLSDLVWMYQGQVLAKLAHALALNGNDDGGEALVAGQAYWATISAGANGAALTVTKSEAGAAPLSTTQRPTVPAGEILVAYVHRAFAGTIAQADIYQDAQTWGYFLLYGAGLTRKIGPGQAFAGGSLVTYGTPRSVTFPASTADLRLWLLPNGALQVAAGPGVPDPRALPLWRLATGVADLTNLTDVRPWVRSAPFDLRFSIRTALTVGQSVYVSIPQAMAISLSPPNPVYVAVDGLAGASGESEFDLEALIGGAWASLFPSSATIDRRPAVAAAGPPASLAAVPEVWTLLGPVQLRCGVLAVPAGASPQGAEVVLSCEVP